MIGSIGTTSIDAEGMLVGPVAVADAGLKSYQELKESGVSWLGKELEAWTRRVRVHTLEQNRRLPEPLDESKAK